jgi:hypothetical protein
VKVGRGQGSLDIVQVLAVAFSSITKGYRQERTEMRRVLVKYVSSKGRKTTRREWAEEKIKSKLTKRYIEVFSTSLSDIDKALRKKAKTDPLKKLPE